MSLHIDFIVRSKVFVFSKLYFGITICIALAYVHVRKQGMKTPFAIKVVFTLFLLMNKEATDVDGGSNTAPPNLCFQWNNQDCLGGDNALLSTGLWMNYTSNFSDETGGRMLSYACQIWVYFNSTQPALDYCEGPGPRNITNVKYYLEQPEHGGGGCHCVNISFNNDCSFPNNSSGEIHRYYINCLQIVISIFN